MQLNTGIWNNKDDIQEAVRSLHNFTHNWCLNCEETEKKNDLVFRCKECEFHTEMGKEDAMPLGWHRNCPF